MSKAWSFYWLDSGRFTGASISCDLATALKNVAPGQALAEGFHDHLSRRVDVATGQVEDWQPPAPPDTKLLTHAWDADTKRWIGQPTLANHKQRAAQAIKAQIAAIEATQPRAVREAILDGFSEASRATLRDIEARIAAQRLRLAAIYAAADEAALGGG